ncbi:phage portal protein, partial [Neorhizobium galegae]
MAQIAIHSPKSKGTRNLVVGLARAAAGGINSLFEAAYKTYHTAATSSDKFEIPQDIGPNQANGEIPLLRSRSRQAKENSSHYKQGITQLVTNTAAIMPIINDTALQLIWDRFGHDIDIRGILKFDTLLAQAAEAFFTDGEVFLVILDTSHKNYPSRSGLDFKIAVWEADHCQIGWSRQLTNGNYVRDGIEFDDMHRVVAYWLYTSHPRDWVSNIPGQRFEPIRFEAEHVMHIYKPSRPGSNRGAPFGSAALPTLELVRRYMLNEVEKKAVQSKHTIFYIAPDL